jgi:lipoate-protein ligase B
MLKMVSAGSQAGAWEPANGCIPMAKAAMMPIEITSKKAWLSIDMPETDYNEAWQFQSRIVQCRKNGVLETDLVLMLEHPSVFTLGRRGGKENLMVSESFLQKTGIPIVHVERGGNITYHGPGQLVSYPIIHLHAAKLSITDYVNRLEEVMIRTAAHWGVQAARSPVNHGVWVGNRKLGSIGIAVRGGISFHGFAFNVNVSLEPFRWINPCGLQGIEMTSLAQELFQRLPLPAVRQVVKQHIEDIFQIDLKPMALADLKFNLNGHRPI